MSAPANVTAIDSPLAQVIRARDAYLTAGRSVVMCSTSTKKPTHKWKAFQISPATPQQVAGFPGNAVALICGRVSGNLECLDFDDKGSCYATWAELVEAEAPGLLSRLTVEQSPSGGFHVTYLCPEAVIDGNTKLAARGPDDDLIETRGEGGYFLCAPSPGYKLLQGNHRELATVTPKERRIMWVLPGASTNTSNRPTWRATTVGNGGLDRLTGPETPSTPTLTRCPVTCSWKWAGRLAAATGKLTHFTRRARNVAFPVA